MTQSVQGIYENGKVTLPEGLGLPEGTRVQVTIPALGRDDQAFRQWLESAPEDDEPLTSEDERAIEEAERSIREEGTVSWEAAVHALPLPLRTPDPQGGTAVVSVCYQG